MTNNIYKIFQCKNTGNPIKHFHAEDEKHIINLFAKVMKCGKTFVHFTN